MEHIQEISNEDQPVKAQPVKKQLTEEEQSKILKDVEDKLCRMEQLIIERLTIERRYK